MIGAVCPELELYSNEAPDFAARDETKDRLGLGLLVGPSNTNVGALPTLVVCWPFCLSCEIERLNLPTLLKCNYEIKFDVVGTALLFSMNTMHPRAPSLPLSLPWASLRLKVLLKVGDLMRLLLVCSCCAPGMV